MKRFQTMRSLELFYRPVVAGIDRPNQDVVDSYNIGHLAFVSLGRVYEPTETYGGP